MDEGALLKRIETRIAEMTARGEAIRADDNPEALKKRLDAYRSQTAPLSAYYAKKGTLLEIDGMAPIPVVEQAIERGPEGPKSNGLSGFARLTACTLDLSARHSNRPMLVALSGEAMS